MIRKIKSSFSRLFRSETDQAMSLMILAFAAGALLGSFSGCLFTSGLGGTTLTGYIEQTLLYSSIWDSIFGSFKFLLMALLFSTSFLGVLLLPSLAFVKAYTFTCSVAAIYVAYSFSGLLCCFFALALPTAILFPCLLLAFRDSFYQARHLFEFKLYNNFAVPRTGIVKHTLAISVLLFLVACYDYFLLPDILAAIL